MSDREISGDEIGRELIVEALAWFIRRAQWDCADPLPLVSHLLRDDLDGGRRFDRYLSSRKMTDEKAAGVLRYYGYIPRRRKSGPKGKTFSERLNRERNLRNYEHFLREAEAIHLSAPRTLTDVDEIASATDFRPDLPRELYGIVARYRSSSLKEDALAALVGAYVFGTEPKAARQRHNTISKTRARKRTHPPR